MARASLDHDATCTVLAELAPLGRVRRWRARSPLGAEGVLHRVALDAPGLDRDHLEPQFQRWGSLRSPHAPMLVDAWFTPADAAFLVLEPEAVALDEPSSVALLDGGVRGYAREASRQALAALAALHEFNISHRRLSLRCFGTAPGGVVVLRDWGLCGRIERLVEQERVAASALQLTTSHMARDVADWAAAMGELLLGAEVLPEGVRQADEPDEARVSAAASRLLEEIADEPLAALLADCLRAHVMRSPRFDSALEALDAFPKGPPPA